MGVLFAFAVGYVVGARAGTQEFDDVVRALQEVRQSEEVRDLWSVLRIHLAQMLRSTAQLLEQAESPASDMATSLVDRVNQLTGRR